MALYQAKLDRRTVAVVHIPMAVPRYSHCIAVAIKVLFWRLSATAGHLAPVAGLEWQNCPERWAQRYAMGQSRQNMGLFSEQQSSKRYTHDRLIGFNAQAT